MAYDQRDYGFAQGGLSESAAFAAKAAFDSPVDEGPFSAAARAFEEARVLATRVASLADRLCGPVPPPSINAASNTTATPPILVALRLGSEQTTVTIGEAHQALDRIERHLS